MKNALLFICLFSWSSSFAQGVINPVKESHFGVAVNSNFGFVFGSISFAPTVFLHTNRHQFEAGFGIYPFEGDSNRKLGVEFNYKYFVNGIDNRFNMYFVGQTGFLNSFRDTPYYTFSDNFDIRENHLSLMLGYGFQLNLFRGAYIGTQISAGEVTYSRHYIGSYDQYHGNVKMFEEFYFDGAIQVSIGYRFR